MVFIDRFDEKVQDMAWCDSVVCLEFSVAFEDERWTVSSGRLFCRNSPFFGGQFNHVVLGGGTWPSTLNWMIMLNNFDHST